MRTKKKAIMAIVILLITSAFLFVSCKSESKEEEVEGKSEEITAVEEVKKSKEANVKVVDASAANEVVHFSFEEGLSSIISANNAAYEVTEVNAVDGENSLKVTYMPSQFSSVVFTPEEALDFGENTCLSFVVTNPSDEVITLNVRVDDDIEEGPVHSTTSIASIQPNSTQRMYMGFSENSLDLGMRYFPAGPAGTNIGYGWGSRNLNVDHIVGFRFWMMDNKSEKTLYIDDIKVIADPDTDISYLNNYVDEFGQYAFEEWEGKITSDEDLIADKEEELLALNNSQANASNTSKYGGWLDGPKLQATGSFRTEKYQGQWTMVDPEGYLYIATGIDLIRLSDGYTWIDGRNDFYDNIPSQDGPLGEHYSLVGPVARSPLGLETGWAFNFYSANLERKYGEDYLNEWKDITVKRMKDWGFTSLGNWSDRELFLGQGEDHNMAYAAQGWINGDFARISSGANEFWRPIPDAFDPKFREAAKTTIEEIETYGVSNDPYCMGIYLDNEIAWGNPISDEQVYAVVTGAFKLDAATEISYGKRAIVEAIKSKYDNDIEEVNKAWGTTISDFAVIEAPYEFEALTPGVVEDLSMGLSLLAEEYYKVVDEELDKVMPKVLNLGSRFAEWGTSLEVQLACAKYADIVSFNAYKKGVTGHEWMHEEAMDKPLIIGEFMFRTTGRGYIGTGIQATIDHETRGTNYISYIESVLSSPYYVGAHWFQYTDQPLTGRAWDGENYNAGFVNIVDQPYEALVEAAKEVHSTMYDLKFKGDRVDEVNLNHTSGTINVTQEEVLQLTATVLPAEAEFKDVVWHSSDSSIAKVTSEGLVIGVQAGRVVITATSTNNPEAIASCELEVTVDSKLSDFETISFEVSEDLSILVYNKQAVGSYVSEGATDGDRGLLVDVGTLDADYSSVLLTSETTWSFGQDSKLTVDLTNPTDEEIQVRSNVKDTTGATRTYYFILAANTTETVEMTEFGPSEPNWDPVKGYFGAKATGVDIYNIKDITFYLWEEKPDATVSTFIIDNIQVVEAQ